MIYYNGGNSQPLAFIILVSRIKTLKFKNYAIELHMSAVWSWNSAAFSRKQSKGGKHQALGQALARSNMLKLTETLKKQTNENVGNFLFFFWVTFSRKR